MSETLQADTYTWTVGYGYTGNGHLASLTYPDSLTVDYAPNALGQPTQAGTWATNVTYYPNGAIAGFTYGNGIVHTLTQNARGLPERSRDANGSTAIHDDSVDYDANGNVLAISDGVAGNLANKNGVAYTFDYGNRLRAGGPETYRYDAHGRRVRSSSSAGLAYSLYSQSGQILFQRDERSSKRRQYIYLGGSLVAERSRPIGSSTETVTYQHTDALGTPVAITNGAKTVLERREYEPYGFLTNGPTQDGPGYTGHITDAATGLVYMQQRYYDPGIGRDLSVDQVTAYDSGDTRFFNRYAYTFNNPFRFVDMDGRFPDETKRSFDPHLREKQFEQADRAKKLIAQQRRLERDIAAGRAWHRYSFTVKLCDTSSYGCTPENMMSIAIYGSAPILPGMVLVSGQLIVLPGNNPVWPYHDYENNRITNLAVPPHVFKGVVDHDFYESGGSVFLTTTGYGSSNFQLRESINTFVGYMYFRMVYQPSVLIRAQKATYP